MVWGVSETFKKSHKLWQVLWRYFALFIAIAAVILIASLILGSLLASSLWEWGIGIGLVAGLAVALVVLVRSYFRLGDNLKFVQASRAERAKVTSLLESLGPQMGITRPTVRILDSDDVNAVVVPRGLHSVQLIISRGAFTRCSWVVLEALVARQLSMARLGLLRYNAAIAGIEAFFGRHRFTLTGWQRYEAALLDLAALAVTHYPPALAELLGILVEQDDRVEGPQFSSWMWLHPGKCFGVAEDLWMRQNYVSYEVWSTANTDGFNIKNVL
jgi:hypothetical protein